MNEVGKRVMQREKRGGHVGTMPLNNINRGQTPSVLP
jgi:hypothetical protein